MFSGPLEAYLRWWGKVALVTDATKRGTLGMDFASRALRDVSYSAWALFATILCFVAGSEFAFALVNGRSWRFVALCALALAASLATLRMALGRLRGKPLRSGVTMAGLLTITATLLVLLVSAVSLAGSAS